MYTQVFYRICAAEALQRESPYFAGWLWVRGLESPKIAVKRVRDQISWLKNQSFMIIYGRGSRSMSREDSDDLYTRIREYQAAQTYLLLAASSDSKSYPVDFQHPQKVAGEIKELDKLQKATFFLNRHIRELKAEIFRTPEAEFTPLGVLWEWKAQKLPNLRLVKDWAKYHNVPAWAL